MLKLKELYDYCQTLSVPPRIKRNLVAEKITQLTGLEARVFIVDLDTEVCRGLFLSACNEDVPLVRMAGGKAVIAIARGMNRCWDRFVQVKELMHLFDSEDEMTGTPEAFKHLLTEFSVRLPDFDTSKQMNSEVRALVMALACLCPETQRLQFVEARKRGEIDNYQVAVQLRIPEFYVQTLLVPRFAEIVASFWAPPVQVAVD